MSELYPAMTTKEALQDGEHVIQSFYPDRATYWRDHAWIAAFAMGFGMAVLWLMGNPHAWTGAVGGLAAIAVRGGYLASDELKVRWDLTNRRLLGPMERVVRLDSIKELKSLGSAVQIITQAGDKHLMKYQKDRDATRRTLKSAIGSVT